MRYDPADPNPGVEVARRLADLRDRTLRADQRTGRSHVHAARLDDAAPATTSATPVPVYALTVVGDATRSLVVIVDVTGTGYVGVLDSSGATLVSVPVGGTDQGRITLPPVGVGPNDRVLAIWASSGSISARLIAAWVPDV